MNADELQDTHTHDVTVTMLHNLAALTKASHRVEMPAAATFLVRTLFVTQHCLHVLLFLGDHALSLLLAGL